MLLNATGDCPVCNLVVYEKDINAHLDSNCSKIGVVDAEPKTPATQQYGKSTGTVSSFFSSSRSSVGVAPTAASPPPALLKGAHDFPANISDDTNKAANGDDRKASTNGFKRSLGDSSIAATADLQPIPKRVKPNALEKAAPLAERMRPKSLDEVCGQDLVGPHGVLRGLIEADRVPSMILWGSSGTGKTTIARLVAKTAGTRFVEINSTSSGVAECKKLFAEAKSELSLTGRKTIVFCDEIHRFSKSQQDVFLGPVESGQVTLIGATTENPSFKVANALLSRCRTFTLSKLTDEDITSILTRALFTMKETTTQPCPLLDDDFLAYLAAFSDGDARTALNLLELAFDLSSRPGMSQDELKKSLTHTMVYDRAGDQHYDTISAFHKSVRGSDADAALYYLARMIQSGEDALYIARRMVVMASEDIGLGDNTILPLCIAAYTAAEKIGLPEARINLAHATVALCLAKKSTRAYKGLNNAMSALSEPGIAALPIPIHLRNAPTKLMKELNYGKEYKYPPEYVDGLVVQEYLPHSLKGRTFLEDNDLGTKVDLDLP